LLLNYIIYFDIYDCTHNGDEPRKDSGMNLNKFEVKERRLEGVGWIYLAQDRAK